MPAKISPASFVERARTVHDSKYTYVNITLPDGVHSKVQIVCPVHGQFEQKANDHLRGCGCFKCRSNYPKTPDIIVDESRSVHGDKFTYDTSTIRGMMNKMLVTCTTCECTFFQTPNDHIKHQAGCPQCAGRAVVTTPIFIQRAKELHGDRYDYSLVECKGVHKKVIIRCSEHGDFAQTPRHHLYGQGCPSCRMSAGEHITHAWLKRHNVEFVYQHRFPDCVSSTSRQLPFDFWLPASNVLVEVDGEQHHKPNRLFNRTMSFERIQKHDSIKNDYAARNGITLIRLVGATPKKMVPMLDSMKGVLGIE